VFDGKRPFLHAELCELEEVGLASECRQHQAAIAMETHRLMRETRYAAKFADSIEEPVVRVIVTAKPNELAGTQ
jgi:hypothetical protein